MKKILLLTRNLPPLVGGMERLVWHMVDELGKGFKVCVIGPPGCKKFLPDEIETMEVSIEPLSLFLANLSISAIKAAIFQKPDVVLAGSGLTAPSAFIAAKAASAKSVVYLHGLDVEVKNKLYRALWYPVFRKCHLILVNSHFTKKLALNAGVSEECIKILHPGVSLPDISQAQERAKKFRKRYGLGDAPVMLYVGRITPRKGLRIFIEKMLPRILSKVPDAKLVVIGDEPKEALLQNRGEKQLIENFLNRNGYSKTVFFLGKRSQDDPEISDAYFTANVLVFPVQERPGDNEGFGMVAVEAAAHGTPTVAFNAGGVADAIKNMESGILVPPGEMNIFIEKVINYLESVQRSARNGKDPVEFASKFHWKKFGRNLRELCNEVIDATV